jgi:hypothetical protein
VSEERKRAIARREPHERCAWRPITEAHNQTTLLVCNQAYLGWHAVAIQNALGEWYESGSRYETRLKYEPTHFQELPSIRPLQVMFAERPERVQ